MANHLDVLPDWSIEKALSLLMGEGLIRRWNYSPGDGERPRPTWTITFRRATVTLERLAVSAFILGTDVVTKERG
jgi:hypothetical protein